MKTASVAFRGVERQRMRNRYGKAERDECDQIHNRNQSVVDKLLNASMATLNLKAGASIRQLAELGQSIRGGLDLFRRFVDQ